uniref:TIL domain-containing protein n=1 Tax=Anopheles dirus TaxID=7168 RepID=A0A182N9H2_9DIPT
MLRNVAVLVLLLSALLCVCAQGTKPASCKSGEEYQKCGSVCEEAKCKVVKPKPVCKKECTPGCYCVKGYSRNTSGSCVPNYMCTYPQNPILTDRNRLCNRNEEYTTCGNRCMEPKCGGPKKSDKVCPMVCQTGCFCKQGYARNANGSGCSLVLKYPICLFPNPDDAGLSDDRRICKEGEVYMSCSSRCAEEKCKPSKPQVCDVLCGPGCFCKAGYARNNNDVCVPEYILYSSKQQQNLGSYVKLLDVHPLQHSILVLVETNCPLVDWFHRVGVSLPKTDGFAGAIN